MADRWSALVVLGNGREPGVASWAQIRSDGSLVFGHYDRREAIRKTFGPSAFTSMYLLVAASDKDALLMSLGGGHPEPSRDEERDRLLLDFVQMRLGDCFDAQYWLEAHAIPYRKADHPSEWPLLGGPAPPTGERLARVPRVGDIVLYHDLAGEALEARPAIVTGVAHLEEEGAGLDLTIFSPDGPPRPERGVEFSGEPAHGRWSWRSGEG